MKYLLDTNICIYLMKDQPPVVRERFALCFYGDVGISAITLAELQYGVEAKPESRSQNARALALLLNDLVIAPFEAGAAAAYGVLRAAAPKGRADALDKLIASHAVALNAVVVTNNTADFIRYPGITTENWIN